MVNVMLVVWELDFLRFFDDFIFRLMHMLHAARRDIKEEPYYVAATPQESTQL